jgi:two-component system OmpR family response regulator
MQTPVRGESWVKPEATGASRARRRPWARATWGRRLVRREAGRFLADHRRVVSRVGLEGLGRRVDRADAGSAMDGTVAGMATGAAVKGRASMRILLVEDDKDLQRLLKRALGDAGYVVDVASDGEEGHYLGDTEPYDAVILDLGLPKMDGVRVLENWRKDGKKMPVLILTARDRWSDKVAGFDAGADDYLAKPFYTEELLARVRALLRRTAGLATSEIEIGSLRIDTRSSRVTVDGNPVKLTSLEYRLLAYLAHHRGRVVSRTELVEHLYDQDFDRDSNTIEVFVGRLRKKLDSNLIQTVRGLGYCLETPDKIQDGDHAPDHKKA